jgi:hypothetical protein
VYEVNFIKKINILVLLTLIVRNIICTSTDMQENKGLAGVINRATHRGGREKATMVAHKLSNAKSASSLDCRSVTSGL